MGFADSQGPHEAAMKHLGVQFLKNRTAHTKACGLTACFRCDEERKEAWCAECVHVEPLYDWLPRGFKLNEAEGRCYLPAEEFLSRIGFWLLFVIVLIIVVAAIMQFLVVQLNAFKKASPETSSERAESLSERVSLLLGADSPSNDASPEAEEVRIKRSREAIRHGLTSWLQRQMRDWTTGNPERFDCRTNLSKKFLIGVGLPLFYGFKWLVFCSSLLITVVIFAVETMSGLRDVLKDLDAGKHRAEHFHHQAVAAYAEYMFYACGFLYFALLALAVRYSNYQRRFKRWFDIENSTMSDFTLELTGVSKNEICETKLKKAVEKHMQCEGQVLGVSIAYDLTQPELSGTLFDMLERRFINEDVRFSQEGSDLAKELWGYPQSLARPEQLKEDADELKFQQLWDEKKFVGSGTAYVVFKSTSQCDAIRMKFSGLWMEDHIVPQSDEEVQQLKMNLGGSCMGIPLELLEDPLVPSEKKDDKSFEQPFARLNGQVVVHNEVLKEGTKVFNPDKIAKLQKVKLERLVSVNNEQLEPTSTLWWNFGTHRAERDQRLKENLGKVVLTFFAIVGLVYMPLFYYLTTPYAIAAGSPGFMCSQMQGILLGISGNILGIVNWNAVCSIGVHKKPHQDIHFVRFSTGTNFFNTAFFLVGGLYHFLATGFNQVDMTWNNSNTPEALVSEWALYRTYYFTLIPGWLFSGAITGKLMGLVIPVLQNWVLLNVVFTMRCLPECLNKLLTAIIPWNPKPDWLTARHAEHIFEPPEVALAWEYGQYIVTPTICCLALFMMGPSSWRVFLALAVWVAFMYFLHRATLVISKKQMTGSYIEELAERMWAFPLGTILSACGFWGVRCEKLGQPGSMVSYWTSFFLFCCGALLHQTMLRWFGGYDKVTFDSRDVPYEEVKRNLRYTWFNTNPVHVLKSCFYPQKLGDDSIISKVPFEYGKEYLLLTDREANVGKAGKNGAFSSNGEPKARHGCIAGPC